VDDKAAPPGGGSEQYFFWVVLTLLIVSKGEGLELETARWLTPWSHRILISVLTGGLVAAGLTQLATVTRRRRLRRKQDQAVFASAPGSVFAGRTDQGEAVYIKPAQRAMHTQVIGTTNAGKTESVILPWAIQDIEQGRGLILIDGKADRALLDKLWAYAVKNGRQKDFKLFSLSHIDQSQSFNPLIGGTPEEIAERVFNAFEFENPHFRSIQFEVFSQVMRIFSAARITPTFLRVHQAVSDVHALVALCREIQDPGLRKWADAFRDLSASDRSQRTSGLLAALSHFAFGKTAALFNTEQPGVSLEEALEKNQIIYFQLPVLLSPFLGKAAGKMILQCLQSAIANRHRGGDRSPTFFSVFLDDFSEYLYPGFVSILNKSRSANIGIVFAHQALGDIKTLGDAIANSILTNANLKIFMRGNDPDSAEYFSKVIGTAKAVKYTERTRRGAWWSGGGNDSTGDASSREVEEFVVHPNQFKRDMGVGEAWMILPHSAGSRSLRIRFEKYDDLIAPELVEVPKVVSGGLRELESKKAEVA
jgi:hypothetical protein